MKSYTLIIYILLISLLAGCQFVQEKAPIHAINISYLDEDILTITGQFSLSTYTQQLTSLPSGTELKQVDISFKLRTYSNDEKVDYVVAFDFINQEAVAMGPKGIHEVPYVWLDTFLEHVSIQSNYDYITPPTQLITIKDYSFKPSYDANWYVSPSPNIRYNYYTSNTHHNLYHSDTLELHILNSFNDNPPDQAVITITHDDRSYSYDWTLDTSLPKPIGEGLNHYSIVANWVNDFPDFSGDITYTFDVEVILPASYTLNGHIFEPGDCMAIQITKPRDLDYRIETETYGKTIGLFYYDTELVGLIPLDSRTKPGDYTVKVYRDSNNALLETIKYSVIEKEFETQQLTVSSSTASLKSNDNYAKDAAKFGDAKTYSVGEKLWEGTFLQPVEGRISTEYSVIRYVNGNTESSRHSGIDIAAPTGTPVLAANNGIVTFASDLIISGNVVVLDHGYGLFTSYVHMDKIHVEDGQEVAKGDIIGEVGSTGYSTGPHLHWTVWKNGVFLNPWKFIAEDPLAVFE